MRFALLALIALTACARSSGTPSPAPAPDAKSAVALGLPACTRGPALDSLMAGNDWREAEDIGTRFCIPGHWRQRQPNVWETDGIIVALYESPSVRLEFPRKQVATGRTWGFAEDTIGGRILEMWTERNRMESGPPRFDVSTRNYRDDARLYHGRTGYSSYGIYRDLDFIFRASVRKEEDIELTRTIFRTLRFAPTYPDRLSGQTP
jgi:hypothetical protein